MQPTESTRKEKPLHKDPSFWIVAVVAVATANVLQLSFGIPWFTEKIQATKTAPRTEARADARLFGEMPPMDLSKKTYAWQAPRFNPRLLSETPPQVVIVPTEYAPPSGGWTIDRTNLAMGIRVPVSSVVRAAYRWPTTSRLIWPDRVPRDSYDFIANLPSGALEALQKEIEKKLGIVATRETRSLDVYLLKVRNPEAPALKPPNARQPGRSRLQSATMLVQILEPVLAAPVVDQTGLTGPVDIDLPAFQIGAGLAGGIEQAKRAVLDMGLELVSTNMPVEVLVVKNVN